MVKICPGVYPAPIILPPNPTAKPLPLKLAPCRNIPARTYFPTFTLPWPLKEEQQQEEEEDNNDNENEDKDKDKDKHKKEDNAEKKDKEDNDQ